MTAAMAGAPPSTLARRGMLADPGDHFSGRYEVERKYAVDDLEAIKARIEAESAVAFALGNRETDIFLDWPDGRLAALGKQQVLRSMQPSGRVLWFVKGPRPEECVVTNMDNFEEALAVLFALGCVEIDRLEKHRDVWLLGDFHLTLDRVPGLGRFVEISVMTDDEASLAGWAEKIEGMAATLGFKPSALQTRSYRAMLAEAGPAGLTT